MAPDEKPPPGAKDVAVFAGFSLLNGVLVGIGAVGALGFSWGRFAEVWLWIFAFPAMAFHRFLRPIDDILLLCLNSLFYGLMWWFAWRMFRLMRAKRPEDESPTQHNE